MKANKRQSEERALFVALVDRVHGFEANISSNSIDSLCLGVDQAPRYRDMAIFVLTMTI